MKQKKEELNFPDIYRILQKYLEDQGYKQKSEEEKYEFLIHLFYVKDEHKKTEENLILQIFLLKNEGPEEAFFIRLHYYMFALHPTLIKVIVVVPKWMKSSFKKQIEKRCNEKMSPKIGLWEVDSNGEIAQKVNPESIREAMQLNIRDNYFYYMEKGEEKNITRLRKISDEKDNQKKEDLLKNEIEKICQGAALSADGFIDNSVRTLLVQPPNNKGETQICNVLMKGVYEIVNLIYVDKLKVMSDEFFSVNPEDYSFVKKWFNKLWKAEVKADYPDICGKYEELLKNLSPKYRDHFVHQFQVFLLGAIIADKVNKKVQDDLSKGWLLAATVHDFAYPLQGYDQWSNDFLSQLLRFDEPLSSIELKKCYIENALLSRTEHIISSLNVASNNEMKERDKVDLNNKIRRFLYYEITEKKNHCLMSSLALLKEFESNAIIFPGIVLPASFAIAIHDDDIWTVLAGQWDKTRFPHTGHFIAHILGIDKKLTGDDLNLPRLEFVKVLEEKKFISRWLMDICCDIWDILENPPLPNIRFEERPLTFLLILCDNLQDWGRPFTDMELQSNFEKANIKFKGVNLETSKNQIKIQLYSNFSQQAHDYLERKLKDLKVMAKVLKSKTPFIIEYWNRETDKKEKDYTVEILDQ